MTTFSQELFDTICGRVAEGESIRSIVKDKDMPASSTFFLWLAKDKELAEQYARAMEMRAELIFEEVLDIADDGTSDWVDGDGRKVVDMEHISRSRLRVDARKWVLARMNSKKYGEKGNLELTGPDGGPMQIQRIERTIVDPAED